MRFSEAWLREYVNPAIDTDALVHQLTMAGLEVDSVTPAAGDFKGVVVAEILDAQPHPEADRLRICQVGAGLDQPLQIVCGAPNARIGIRVPLALVGALLPGGLEIKSAKLRGIESFGMLCSQKELGIEEDASGLMELPLDAPIGMALRDYLQLDDQLIEVDLTPNRADCLSVEGIAREVALLNALSIQSPETEVPAPVIDDIWPIKVQAPEACPRYLGQLIRGVNRHAGTPQWLKEKLRRSGLRSLDVIVDVTNYILLELGQPLHAFDVDRLEGGVCVRWARDGESLHLLNGQQVTLESETLVIADDRKVLALAGIMGGSDSAVSETTQDIFIECAYFEPSLMMGKARRYGLSTDSSHRFERGVSFDLQSRALARATQLLLTLAGGQAGPVVERVSLEHLPSRPQILLRAERIEKILGLSIPHERVMKILQGLGMTPERDPLGWRVTAPAARFDIALEADLIEEVGRVYGYDHLPRRQPVIPAVMLPISETRLTLDRAKDLLVDRGYQEAITYSFVEAGIQQLIDPGVEPLALKNPLSQELAVMRTSLWPGLLDAAIKNSHRQQDRVRLFESGLTFRPSGNDLSQEKVLSWLALGCQESEQWGLPSRPVDFFDVKEDVEALVALTGRLEELRFVAVEHPALHPGQSAEIRLGEHRLGLMGLLHPEIEKRLGFPSRVFLVELLDQVLRDRQLPRFSRLSKFPSVRRDLALLVEQNMPVETLLETTRGSAGKLLREAQVFDVYQGPGVLPGKKSVAIRLILQDEAETLVDTLVDEVVKKVLDGLTQRCGARLRD